MLGDAQIRPGAVFLQPFSASMFLGTKWALPGFFQCPPFKIYPGGMKHMLCLSIACTLSRVKMRAQWSIPGQCRSLQQNVPERNAHLGTGGGSGKIFHSAHWPLALG